MRKNENEIIFLSFHILENQRKLYQKSAKFLAYKRDVQITGCECSKQMRKKDNDIIYYFTS